MTDPVYPTIADCVGQTPLVRLQRMLEIDNGSQVLLKLEGNNPAGSVKDRPALSMIQQAQARYPALRVLAQPIARPPSLCQAPHQRRYGPQALTRIPRHACMNRTAS